MIGGRLSSPAPYLIRCALFPAAIPQIPLAHDIDKGGELPRTLVYAVHTVADGDEPDTFLPEQNLRIESGLKIISPDSAHVLRQHQSHFPGLNIGNQPLPVGPLEVAAGPAVIGVMDTVGKAVLGGVALQLQFLIDNRIAVPNRLIIAAKPLIKGGNFLRLPAPVVLPSG